MLSSISATPRHVVPPSLVVNPSRSTPEVVKVGAVPPGHFIDAGHVCVPVPPLVNCSRMTSDRLAGTLVNVQVSAPEAVLVKKLPTEQSIAEALTAVVFCRTELSKSAVAVVTVPVKVGDASGA